MRTKSIFGVKSITNLIYGLLMIAPFVAILSRVIYVQANPNAKDSYSDSLISNQVKITNINQLQEGAILQINKYSNNNGYTNFYYFSSISLDLESVLGSQYDSTKTYNQVRTRKDNNNYWLYFKDYDNTINQTVEWLDTFSTFSIKLVAPLTNGYTENLSQGGSIIYQYQYKTETLDNAFEYSLSSFTRDNDIGVINFFGWFEGLFLNQSNAHNMVYLNFANWYMNYALLVSSSYLLFLALIWFVNYIRRILDKSMNHDFGGF